MKKYSVILLACMFVVALCTTSCNRKCKGGGWYGDRNLGFVPAKEKPANLTSPSTCEELTTCEISNP